MASVDFNRYISGRERAENANWRDYLRSHKTMEHTVEQMKWQDQLQKLGQNRQAYAYTAPLIRNMQTAATQGTSPADFLIRQRDQVMTDPNFQAMEPEVQATVLSRLGDVVRSRLQDLQHTGQFNDVAKLTQAYGLVDPVMPIERSAQTGDVAGILSTAGLTADEKGFVDVGGVKIPAQTAALALVRSKGQYAGMLPDASTTALNAIQMQQAQAQLEKQQQSLDALRQRLGIGTTTPDATAQVATAAKANDLDSLLAAAFGTASPETTAAAAEAAEAATPAGTAPTPASPELEAVQQAANPELEAKFLEGENLEFAYSALENFTSRLRSVNKNRSDAGLPSLPELEFEEIPEEFRTKELIDVYLTQYYQTMVDQLGGE